MLKSLGPINPLKCLHTLVHQEEPTFTLEYLWHTFDNPVSLE